MRTPNLNQLSFEGFHRPTGKPPEAARPRLAGQCSRLLAMLRKGDVSNHEMAEISLKYSSRISELRQLGHNITCISHDRKTGKAMYRLAA